MKTNWREAIKDPEIMNKEITLEQALSIIKQRKRESINDRK